MNYKIKTVQGKAIFIYRAIEAEKKIKIWGSETEIVKIKFHGDMNHKPFPF